MATFASSHQRGDTRIDGLTLGGCAVAALCALTDVKAFDIQPIELFVLIYIPMFIALWRFRLELAPPFAVLGRRMLVFFLLMLIGSIASLRLNFFPPGNFGILKLAPYASFVRFGQVVLAFGTFFLVGLAAARSRKAMERILEVFVWSGLVSSVWGIVSFIGNLRGDLELPGAYVYGGVLRASGFFVEGGPFGVYLVGIVTAILTRRYYLQSIGSRTMIVQLAIILAALGLSQSKAAIFAAAVLVVSHLYSTGRLGPMAAAALVLVPMAGATDFGDRVTSYYEASANIAHEIRRRPEDKNYIMGRLAASVILPRMVQEHPILGIGIGNYSLVRNDPKILRGLPQVREWDLPGLGLFGYVAELGIPLTFYLLFLYAYPLLLSRRVAVPNGAWLSTLGTFPICATLFGAQVTFAYPWIVAALVVAMICIQFRSGPPNPVADA